MNSNKKSTPPRFPAPFNRPAAGAKQFKPAVAQLKSQGPAQDSKTPVAPAVYRPQATPRALQAKSVIGEKKNGRQPAQPDKVAGSMRTGPRTAPDVYRPGPVPKVLQKKTGPVAPQAYNPRPVPKCQQTKSALAVASQQHRLTKTNQSSSRTLLDSPQTSKTLQRATAKSPARSFFGVSRGTVQRAESKMSEQREKDRVVFEPSNHKNPTEKDFEYLRNSGSISINDLMDLIPQECEDTYVGLHRTVRGFKFTWEDDEGIDWEVWGHEPDAGAAAGHAGADGWTVRIKHGNRYLMSEYVDPPVGDAYNWTVANSAAKIRMSHIGLEGVK